MRKIFFTVVLTLLALAAVTTMTAWFLLRDEAFLKSRLADIVIKQTGRELRIKGLLRLELGRKITLEAQDLVLQNAEWADQASMVSVGHLLIQIDLPSLLGEVPVIPLLEVENCRISLVKNNAGEANWDLLTEPEPRIKPTQPLPESLPVLLQDIQMRNCSLDFNSPDRDQPLIAEVENISLQILKNMRVVGHGNGRINGAALSFSGGYSPLDALLLGGSLEYDLNLQLGDISLQSSGVLENAATLAGANIETYFRGPEIGQVLNTFSLPPLSEGPFYFRLDLVTEGQMTKLNLDGDLGKLSINASGQLDRLVQPQFGKLLLDMKGPDLEALGAALDFADLVPEPFSLQGDMAFNKGTITVQSVIMETLEDHLEASGVLGPAPDFANSDLDIKINSGETGRWRNRFDLPAALSGTLQIESQLSSDADGIFSTNTMLKSADFTLNAKGTLGKMMGTLQPDLEISATTNNLQTLGVMAGIDKLPATAAGAQGHIHLSGRKIQLQGLKVDLAEHHALFNGLLNLEDNYSGSALGINLESPDIAALGRLFGQQDNIPQQPLKLNLHLKREGKSLVFRVKDSDLGDIEFALEGRITDLKNPLVVNTTFEFRLPGLHSIAFLLPEFPLPQGALTARGKLKNEKGRTWLEGVHLQLDQVKATIDGNIQHDNHFQLAIKASGPDASILEQWTGRPLEPEPFSLDTRLTGSPSEFELTELDFRFGNSVIRGQLKIIPGDLTRISGRLDSPFLDLTQWTAEDNDQAKQMTASSNAVFDNTPVMEISDYGVIADMELNIERASLANTVLREVRLGLQLQPKYLELKPFSFKGSTGGVIHGTALLDSSGSKPRFNLKLKGQELHFGFAALEGQDPATFPPLDIDLMLEGKGVTLHEMASSLNGKARLHYHSGMFASAGLSLLLTDFATELFNTLNPFRKSTDYTELSCAVLAADFTHGMVNVFPFIIQTSHVTILSQGVIDLASEDIDFSFNSKTRTGLGLSVGMLINPFIKVGGSLSSPIIELDPANSMISGGIAVATAGLSLVAKSMSDRFLSSKDPCGDALEVIAEKEQKRGQLE